MSAPSLGFVGFGEAARCFAAHLKGTSEISVFCEGGTNRHPYSDAFLQEVAVRGAEAVDSLSTLAARSEVVVSAVVVATAVPVGCAIAAAIRPGTLVVDVNASTPMQKQVVAEAVEARGGTFVDANLMGSVSLYGATVPLYCSGSGAERFARDFGPLGLTIEVAGPAAGAAAAVKMLRSVVTKGIEALVIEAMVAASIAGVRKDALRGICDPMDATTFSQFVDMCIRSDVLHADRRAVEMDGIAAALAEMGLAPIMTAATTERLRASASLGVRREFEERAGYTADDVLDRYVARASEIERDRATAVVDGSRRADGRNTTGDEPRHRPVG